MLKITDDNYEQYKKISAILWACYVQLTGAHQLAAYSPDTMLNQLEKQSSKAIAKKALKMGLQDQLTMLLQFPPEVQTAVSEQLVNQGLPPFSALVGVIKDVPQKVLKRGKIKNLQEYYVIKELLDDVDSDLTEEDRVRLDAIFMDYALKK